MHIASRGRNILPLDRLDNVEVLCLKHLEVLHLPVGRTQLNVNGLPRNNHGTKELHEIVKGRIACRFHNALMKLEIACNGGLATADRSVDLVEYIPDRRDLLLRTALSRQGNRSIFQALKG